MSSLFFQLLSVLVLAVLPMSEVRGALPYGILVAKLNPLLVFVLSITGNIFVIYPLLTLLNKIEKFLLEKSDLRFFGGTLEKVVSGYIVFTEKVRRRVKPYVNRYGVVGLTLYTFAPLPFTGAWTATLAAYLLGVERKKAFGSIAFGVVLAGLLILVMIYLGVSIES